MKPTPTPEATEVIDFLYKHGDLTYSAASAAVRLLARNGYGFTRASSSAAALVTKDHINRLCKALEAAETFVIDGVTTAKSNLEMNSAYPTRKPRYEAELQEAREIYDECRAARIAALSVPDELRRIGAQMSNILFNLSQGGDIPERFRKQFRDLTREWDAALGGASHE